MRIADNLCRGSLEFGAWALSRGRVPTQRGDKNLDSWRAALGAT